MKKNENALSVIIKAGMPLVAIAGLVLSQFVSFGAEFNFGITNTTKMVVCAVALFFFYVPIRDIFLQNFNASERTRARKESYENSANLVCDGRTKDFKQFCKFEYDERKRKVVDAILRNTEYTFDTFQAKYHFDKEAVKNDESLSKREKKTMRAAIKEEHRIKPESVDTILPSGKHATHNHRRVRSNPELLSARTLTVKSITSVISCVAFVSIGLSLVEGTTAVAVITTVVMLLALCLWQAFSAYTAARKINNEYCNQLSEKTMFLLEFEEHLKRAPRERAEEKTELAAADIPVGLAKQPYTVTITRNE